MTITGIVKTVFTEETKGNATWRNLWLTTEANTQYPQVIEVQAYGAKTGIFNGLSEGMEVTCHINLKGREYNGRVFNTLQVWKCETGATTQQAQAPGAPAPIQASNGGDPEKDDLPF